MNRRKLLCWLGLAPAVATAAHAIPIPAPRPESGEGLIFTQFGLYRCAECTYALRFEEIDLKKKPTHAVAVCENSRCIMNGARYLIPMNYLRVGVLRPGYERLQTYVEM